MRKRSAIDMLNDPRVIARLSIATNAATAQALADGQRIVSKTDSGKLVWLYPDGASYPIEGEQTSHEST